jgi:hypothetical protein
MEKIKEEQDVVTSFLKLVFAVFNILLSKGI